MCYFLPGSLKPGFLTDIPPLIQTEDDVKYAAVAGASVSLHCEFFASPEATVSW